MWWPAVLVFGLLVGLIGMHGLAFGGSGVVEGRHLSHFSHSAGSSHSVSFSRSAHLSGASHSAHSSVGDMRLAQAGMWGRSADDETVCRSDDAGEGGHAQHADVNCSSGAVGAGAGLTAPPAGSLGATAEAVDGHRSADIGREGGRAPPSLSELQLLRI